MNFSDFTPEFELRRSFGGRLGFGNYPTLSIQA